MPGNVVTHLKHCIRPTGDMALHQSSMESVQILSSREDRSREDRLGEFRAGMRNRGILVDRQAVLVGYFDDNGWGQTRGQTPKFGVFKPKKSRRSL
jgi:hypothetical protein